MRIAVIGPVLLAGSLGAAPAAADPVPVAEALAAVAQACQASRAALISGGGTVTAGDERLAVSPGGFQFDSPAFNRVVLPGVGTYGLVADDGLSRAQSRRAWRHLRRLAADWWFEPDRFWSPGVGWAATFEQSRDAAVSVDAACAQALSAAVEPVQRTGSTWQFTIPGSPGLTVVTDGQGRLTAWADTRYDYGAASVTAPARAVPHAAWQKAAQAASLNSALRTLTRDIARTVNADLPSVAAIDAAARAATPVDRAVPLRVRQLRRGVLFHARNPYTKAYHAWRVYLKGGKAVARRVAP